jgi:hypothetical protein
MSISHIVAILVSASLAACLDAPASEESADAGLTTASSELAGEPVVVPVHWHIIHDGDLGNLGAARIAALTDILNQSFGGQTGGAVTRFSFEIASTTYYDNPDWFVDDCNWDGLAQIKPEIRQGGPEALNIYSCGEDPYASHYGPWTTYPWEYAGNPSFDGIVIQETGHWLGLKPATQNTCEGDADEVADTPPAVGPYGGCPEGRDSCPGGGPDPIHNFMAYSDDDCRYAFTVGQGERAGAMWDQYRGAGTPCPDDPTCNDGNSCTIDSCDVDTDQCVHTADCPAGIAYDDFDTGTWSGGIGGWTAPWMTSGDVALVPGGPFIDETQARLRGGTGLLRRRFRIEPDVELPRLFFASRVSSLEPGDRAVVKVRRGSEPPVVVARFTAADNDDRYYDFMDIDLTSFLPASALTLIFDAQMSAADDVWLVDEIDISGKTRNP